MYELLLAFGRGVVKTSISVFVGTGVGLVTFGANVEDPEKIWHSYGPPPEMFLAVGAGMLSAGAMMLVLFLLPRAGKSLTAFTEKPEPVDV